MVETEFLYADKLGSAGERPFYSIDKEYFTAMEIGDISSKAFLVMLELHHVVNYETGVCHTNVPDLFNRLNGDIHSTVIQDALEELHDKHYIKSFSIPGRHGKYPILIHGYTIKSGDKVGYRLDALNSTNPNSPVYVQVLMPKATA